LRVDIYYQDAGLVCLALVSLLSLMPLIRCKDRPRLILPNSGAEIPLATFSDLNETLSLVEYVADVRPYVLEWFNTVFLAAHSEIVSENIKRAEALTDEEKGKGKKKRDPAVGVTSKELAKWIKAHGSKGMATKYIREAYLEPLYNGGYLEKEENPDDKRGTIYSPITDKQGKLFGENKIPVKDATVYPSQENMTAWIDERDSRTDCRCNRHRLSAGLKSRWKFVITMRGFGT
jgi:hypothetical protein